MRRAFSNPVGKASRLAALAAEPATLTRPVRRPARLLGLVVLVATPVLWAGTALAQTIEISPTTTQTLREGEALKVTLTVKGLGSGQEASIDFTSENRTASLDDFEVYQQATEPTSSDMPVTLTTFTDINGDYAYYTFATGSDPAAPVTFWVLAKTDTVSLEPAETLFIKGFMVVPDPFETVAESSNLTVTLTDATPLPAPTGKPTTPANLTATAGRGAVTLTWDAVDATSSNTNYLNDVQITKHQFRQSTNGGINYGTWTDIPNSAYGEVNANTYTIGSLMDGTEYTFQVRAVNACTATTGCGISAAATATMATPDADALAAPTGLTATAGNAQITLTWTDPGDAAILFYEYQQKEGSAAFGAWTEIPGSSATTTSFRLTGLDNGTAYSYRIRARTSVKPSAATDAVTATPRGAPPAAPVLTVTPYHGAVTLSWPNPLDDSILKWQYQYKVGAGVYQPWQDARAESEEDCAGQLNPSGFCLPPHLNTSGATVRFPVGGLTNGTPHTFRIQAVNVDGMTVSNETTATPVAGVPAKLTGLTTRLLEEDRFTTTRILEWDRVHDPSIERYEFTADRGRTWLRLKLSGSVDRSVGFVPDEFRDGYTYRVRAVNTAGSGPASEPAVEEEDEERVLTRVTVRSASLEWDGTSKATLVWDPLTEHANLRWWRIHFNKSVHGSTARDWDTEDLPIGTTRYEIPATFSAGDEIVVWIYGCVSKGCGPTSPSRDELRFEVGAPDTVVTGFSATAGDGQVTLAWDDPMDSSVTHFEYEVRWSLVAVRPTDHNDIPDGNDEDSNPGNETSHTVTAIYNAPHITDGTAPVNGESYDFRLRAANANGSGPWTEWIEGVMPLAAGVPAAPTGALALLSGAGGGHGHGHAETPGLTTWDDPQDPSITGYQRAVSGISRTHPQSWEDIPDTTTTGANERVLSLRAVNANGPGPSVAVEQVHSPAPARPTGLQAAPGNGRVTLTWDDPGKDVYIEFYRYTTDGGETWTEIPDSRSTVQGQLTRYTVPSLTNGQAHTFAIQAENDTGASPVSAAVTATPRGGAPAKPTGLSAAPGNAAVTLTWDNPRDASITKYQIKQDAANWADISGSDAGTTSHSVGTLTNGTAYTFQIRAVNDHNGDNTDDPGPASDAVTIRPGVPTAPASLSVAPGDAQAILTWTAPASDGDSAVTGYEYTSNADAATPTWTDVPDGSDSGSDRDDETEYTVASLVNNTPYAFAVRAENANGQGAATPTLRATPVPPGTPRRPAGLRATPGHQQVRLTWSPPVNPNHPVTSYQYRQSTDGGTAWNPDWTAITGSDATTTEHLLTGLANGTTYTFELRALKDSTAGPSARAQATPSGAAANVVIDRGSSGQLTTPDGRTYTVTQLSPPTGLNWRIAVPGATEIDDRTFTLRSLQGTTPETSPRYTFTSAGQEGLDILVQPPLAGRAQVCLEPTPLLGQEAGSQPVLVLRYNGASWTPLPTTTDGGMVCGTTSAFSAFVLGYEAAAPQGGAPAEPTGLSAAPGNAEVTLTWDDPRDDSITTYLVKQDAEAWAEISGSDSGTTRHTVGGLSNGTAYTFRIRAVNDHDGDRTDDPGPASDAVTVTAGAPTAPVSLMATAGDTQVTLTWTAPASDNGSPVTGYEYTSNADAATPVWRDVPDSGPGGANENRYTVTGLDNNTPYAFAVRAKNRYGRGPATPTLRATPLHPDAPQQPAGLRATPGDKQVTLTWTLPDVHRPVTSYQYRQSTDGGTSWNPDWTAIAGSGASTTEHVLTGLTNGRTYTFELRALNGSTEGPSAWVQATPSGGGRRDPPSGTNAAPKAAQPLPLQTVRAGATSEPLDLTPYFDDPDGDTLTFAAESDDPGVVIADLPRGSNWLVLRGVAAGEAVVDVTARDPDGEEVSRSLTVTVRAVGAPETAQSLPPQTLLVGETSEPLDLTPYFDDPDGDPLTYTAVSYDEAVLVAEVAEGGSQLTLRAVAAGEAVVIVTARDPDGAETILPMRVTVRTVGAPEAAQPLPPQTVRAGETSEPLDLTPYFDDPDGDPLTFTAVSDDAGVVIADLPRGSNRLILRGVAAGEAVVVVTARDPDGAEVSQPLTVTVRAVAAPEAAQSLPTQTLLVGETSEPLDLTPYFDDPDGDPLTFAAVSDDAGVAIADLPRGSNWLVLRGVAAGEAVVVVTARDPDGAEVSQPLTVTVRTTAAPEAAQSLPTQTLLVGETSEPLDLTPYFRDPDGDPLTYTAVSYDDAVLVAEVAEGGSQLTLRAVGAGEAVVIVTARDADGTETILPMTVTVRANAAPEVAEPLPTQTVTVGETSEPLDLTPYFHDPDGDPLTYAAVWVSDDSVAIAEVPEGGSQLILRGVGAGEARVLVTARDPYDEKARQTLRVTVRANAAPEAAQPLPPRTVLVDTTSEPLDLTPYFDDPDGDPLTYAAVSDNAGVAVAEVAEGGSQLTLRAVGAGEALVVVTARDPYGEKARQSLRVTVRTNTAPEAAQPLPTQTVLVDTTSEPLDLTPYFDDPDGDPLTYAAVSDNAGVAVAEVAEGGSQLTLRAVGAGEALVVVTARDPYGEKARQSLRVTVRTNAAPEVAQPIPARTMLVDTASEPLDLTPYFHDPDGDPLTYAAVSYDDAVLVAEVAEGGSQLTLRAVAVGEAVVVVTARDPFDAEASQPMTLTVRTNAAPEAAQPLPTQTVLVDTTTEPLDLAPYFHDPDGDPLTYAAVSDNAGVAVAEVAEGGSELTLRAVGAGETVVVVTARDPFDAEASQPMTLTVRTNAAPEVAQPLPTRAMLVDTTSEPLDLTPYFHDPDGDPLTYAAASDNAGVAVAELAEGGNELTLRAVGAGEAVVVVTARDPFDAEASQPMTLTVRTNAAPEAAQPLPTQTVLAGTASEPLDLTPYFHDPDGDPLTYAAVSANAAVATAGVVGDLFTLTGVAAGTVVVTVTARDPHDGEASQTVIVTVTAVHADWVKAWAARFGRTVSGHVLDGVQERLRVAPRPGFQATLGGHQLGGISEEASRELGDWQLGGPAAFQRELELLAGLTDDEQMSNGVPQQASTARDLFTSSAFSLTVGNAEEGSSGFGALWGRGAVSRFDGREGPLSLTGEVATGMVGIDWISRRWRTGLALAMSRGIGGYSAGVNSGEIESKLTGLFPWVGYDVTDRVSVWATAGYGAGVLTFTPDSAEAMTAELAMSMVAAGARSELLKLRQLGGVMLALETDTRLTRTTTGAIAGLEATEASVWQRRLGLEGSRPVALGGRLSLRPSVEVGLRYDGGDAETGAGMDVGAGLGFSDSGTGLAVDVHVRTLLVHEAEGFSERGVAFSLSYDPTPSTPLGVTARVAPSWGGQAQSGAAALWGRETMAGMAHGGAAQGYRLSGEVGYGLPVGGRFVGTPRVGFARSEHSRDYRVGYGLGVLETGSLHVEVGVDALRSESPMAGGASNALRGQASLGW